MAKGRMKDAANSVTPMPRTPAHKSIVGSDASLANASTVSASKGSTDTAAESASATAHPKKSTKTLATKTLA